jgi:hypothetical protein
MFRYTFRSEQSSCCGKRNRTIRSCCKIAIPGIFRIGDPRRIQKYYSEIEKICSAVIMCSRKLHHYFVVHHIIILTNQPLHDIMHNRDSSGRIGKWTMELSEYIINFERRSTIKLQILTDFMGEWTRPQTQIDTVQVSPWLVYCD